ncbi:MAG: Flp pilus assembly protein TadD [Halioglobus sp.]|jgi:Flp pilus assembly protein TadD
MRDGVPPTQKYRQCLATVKSRCQLGFIIVGLQVLAACSTFSPSAFLQPDFAPLKLADTTLTLAAVPELAPMADLLAMDDEMKAFVARYASNLGSKRQRLTQLHRSIKSAGLLDIEYDPQAEGTAIEAFHSGSVNCLSYANMMVAMAREAGLDASYQWVDVRPHWSRMGERLAVRLHVNVLVRVRRGEEFMVDIDPMQLRDITSTRVISDRDAKALYHSNLAMSALSREKFDTAWAQAIQALRLNPKMPHLWVNLGAVYRGTDQHDEAEESYLYALKLDSTDRSAMNNLIVLYGLQGRDKEQDYWQQQITRYQKSNPYFHAWKGDKAGEKGDWERALRHYQRALVLNPLDSRLLFSTGIIHVKLDDIEQATRLISQAIEHAKLGSEIKDYEFLLRELEDGTLDKLDSPLAGV